MRLWPIHVLEYVQSLGQLLDRCCESEFLFTHDPTDDLSSGGLHSVLLACSWRLVGAIALIYVDLLHVHEPGFWISKFLMLGASCMRLPRVFKLYFILPLSWAHTGRLYSFTLLTPTHVLGCTKYCLCKPGHCKGAFRPLRFGPSRA